MEKDVVLLIDLIQNEINFTQEQIRHAARFVRKLN